MENKNSLKIGDRFPLFNAQTTLGNIKLSDYIGKWVILITCPEEFSPVSTSELLALSQKQEELRSKNIEILILSQGNNSSNLAWLQNMYHISGNLLSFPIISDCKNNLSARWNLKNNEMIEHSIFILDTKQNIRAITNYPQNIGYDISEIIRVITAMQVTDTGNNSTLANWKPNMPLSANSPRSYYDLLERLEENPLYQNHYAIKGMIL